MLFIMVTEVLSLSKLDLRIAFLALLWSTMFYSIRSGKEKVFDMHATGWKSLLTVFETTAISDLGCYSYSLLK